MSMGEALNRGFNLLATAMVAVSCFTFTPQLYFARNRTFFNLDDLFLLLLGLATIWWYLRHTHRFKRSLMPVIFVSCGLGIKIFGLILNYDFLNHSIHYPTNTYGGIILFSLATIVIVQQYFKTEKLIESFKF